MGQAAQAARFQRSIPMSTSKLFAAIIALGALAACETVQGAGQDISTAGQTISAESQAVQDDL